jgi:hypothetical protein
VHCLAPSEQQPVVDAVRPDQHVPAVGVQGDSLSVALDQTTVFSPHEKERVIVCEMLCKQKLL